MRDKTGDTLWCTGRPLVSGEKIGWIVISYGLVAKKNKENQKPTPEHPWIILTLVSNYFDCDMLHNVTLIVGGWIGHVSQELY